MTADVGPHPSISFAKQEARKRARAKRAVLLAGANATGVGSAYHSAADLFFQAFRLMEGDIVAVYLPHGTEFDIRPILKRLPFWQVITALPVVVSDDAPLIFRVWTLGDPLVPGAFDIPVPESRQTTVVPDYLFVPLTAFDETGMRLGQGGGFYDRTLAELRQKKPSAQSIGLAFEGQKVEGVPHDALDMRLDAVVTEKRCYRFSRVKD